MTADDIFGAAEASSPSSSFSSPAAPTAAAAAPAVAKPPGKGVFDDLDDDFEGLEDAKEGSADDDFANISRDDFNPVFDGSPSASQVKVETPAFSNESTFDFVSHGSAGGSGASQKKPADSHDWDAIFAGLDEPTTMAPPAVPEDKGDLDRPSAPGRALTERGEHDDPILKSLTGMGYSRADSVSALEKYDYNLEKVSLFLIAEHRDGMNADGLLLQAANYLASKS